MGRTIFKADKGVDATDLDQSEQVKKLQDEVSRLQASVEHLQAEKAVLLSQVETKPQSELEAEIDALDLQNLSLKQKCSAVENTVSELTGEIETLEKQKVHAKEGRMYAFDGQHNHTLSHSSHQDESLT